MRTVPDTGPARVAEVAAARSGIVIRELHDGDDIAEVDRLFWDIWRPSPSNVPITNELMRVLAHSGNYVVGAFVGDRMVGATVGFLAAPAGRTLHSHVTGVRSEMRGRSVGFALKLHQRAWALDRGLDTITWTFDPLVRRNAYFNLAKLAATAVEYLPDFYGEMDDGINGVDASDRLLASWDLRSPEVVAACAGKPAEPVTDGVPDATGSGATGSGATVRVPADIESLRAGDPEQAARWRLRVREELGTRMDAGAKVLGFTRDGRYVVA
ncbi:GNAT family N-acetyltransferase [Actinosynnema sp. NPDC050436]|uniref:GNAT family N-acetyltransferase n=1 Tax=Actinosynnema sp. NPDC050436 TaxID=3155659 RepID=UPI0034116794